MKNQIVEVYASNPAALQLPASMDYGDLFSHVLFDRPDIGWQDGRFAEVSMWDRKDQPMIGFPMPGVEADNRLRGRICLVDRNDRILPEPEHDARWAEIERRADEAGPAWFAEAAPLRGSSLMPGSAVCRLPFTATAEETLLYYVTFRYLRVHVDRMVHERGFGYDCESVERHLLYCLCAKMDEQQADLDDLFAHAEEAISEASDLFPWKR